MNISKIEEKLIEEKIERIFTTPLPVLIDKIFNNRFYCASTGKKIEEKGYYSEISMRVYHSKEIAQKEVAHYLNEKRIYEARGKSPYRICTIKDLANLRKNFMLIENNNKFKVA